MCTLLVAPISVEEGGGSLWEGWGGQQKGGRTERIQTSLWTDTQRKELQQNVRALFERFGDTATKSMSCGQAVAFARTCELLDMRLGSADVDINFARVRLSNRRTIGEAQFHELLRMLATRRGWGTPGTQGFLAWWAGVA